jgi:hypothetical protein
MEAAEEEGGMKWGQFASTTDSVVGAKNVVEATFANTTEDVTSAKIVMAIKFVNTIEFVLNVENVAERLFANMAGIITIAVDAIQLVPIRKLK